MKVIKVWKEEGLYGAYWIEIVTEEDGTFYRYSVSGDDWEAFFKGDREATIENAEIWGNEDDGNDWKYYQGEFLTLEEALAM